MRKQEHIWEMQKAATLDGYLNDITRQTLAKLRKEKMPQDIKNSLIYCIPKFKNYAFDSETGAAARDEVLEFLEKICDNGYELNTSTGLVKCVHDARIFITAL